MAIQGWIKYIDLKKTKGKNAPAFLKEQKEETHELPSSKIGEVEEVVNVEDRNSLQMTMKNMKRHQMSIKNFLL